MADVAKKNPGQVSAYLDENLLTKLKSMAAADERSISYLVEKAVREMIGKPENVVKWRQVHLEDAIAQAKPGSVKAPAKHK